MALSRACSCAALLAGMPSPCSSTRCLEEKSNSSTDKAHVAPVKVQVGPPSPERSGCPCQSQELPLMFMQRLPRAFDSLLGTSVGTGAKEPTGHGETQAKAMLGGKGEVCAVGSVMSCWFAASLSFCFCCLFSEHFPSSGIERLCNERALK